MTLYHAAITGVQGWVPNDVLSNKDLEQMVDTNDEWIRSRTGIEERRILRGDDKGTSDMAVEAVKGLLAKTKTKPEEVELVIFAYKFGQEEETYNIVAAHGYFGRLIFQYASFNNSRANLIASQALLFLFYFYLN
jgi:3-oxoacyl-[acyl-carrier-protein] synthase III